MQEYARLDLIQEVTAKNGAIAKEVIIYRPTCRAMMDVLDAVPLGSMAQTERFVSTSVRALNGGSEPLEFNAADLNAGDNGQIGDIIAAMRADATAVHLPHDTGDGITAPLVYTLQFPIKLTPREDAQVLRQIQFEARRLREISEFLDAPSIPAQFRAFMRSFGTPMGIQPAIMSDILIDSLDYIDYLVISGNAILGKFAGGPKRWRKTSLPSH